MAYDLSAIRKKIQDAAGKRSDPLEFKPKKAADGEVLMYRFFILPPLSQGDKCHGGKASKNMELFSVQNGVHWVNNRPYGCPRIIHGEQCPVCDAGFKMLANIPKDDVQARTQVKQVAMPTASQMVNIYFTDSKSNPEELRKQVRYFAAPHTCFKLWSDAINRDGPGDPEDPQAFGVFFDEKSSYLFQLTVNKNGQNNSYSQSKFIVGEKGSRPIAEESDIQSILDRRIDLFTKLQDVDSAVIAKIANQIVNGDDDSNGGFDEDDTKPVKLSDTKKADTLEEAVETPTGRSSASVKPKAQDVKPKASDAPFDDDGDEVDRLMAAMNADSDDE